MYEGGNTTALSSQKAIADALFSLLETKPYKDISVSEICKKSGVSRQTFYTLFQTKENVIVHKLKNSCAFFDEHNADKNSFTLRNICHYFGLYITMNGEFLKQIIENELTFIIYDDIYQACLSCEQHVTIEECEGCRGYIATFAAGGLTGIIKHYIKDGQTKDAKYIEEITYKLLSGAFFQKEADYV
jgi:AcrR family transcriptional regulator